MIAKDKQKHFIYGVAISLIISIFTTPLIGFIFTSLIGVGKELIWDKWLDKGNPEILDALFTIAGALLSSLFIQIL